MQQAAPLILKTYKGEDYELHGVHKASRAPGAPVVDISTWTIVFTLREAATDPNPPVLSISAMITDGDAGAYSVALTAAQTLALGVGTFACDLWRTNNGAQTEMAVGTLEVLQPVRNP